ncbi:tRNA (guanine(26)-N(2))-dimethyltransferase [Vairimorpha necatrix]|uniref:tRNA (guanine(26)-N(2))-dimethyltransferase n=1 Tax=Vairimorpha necatrix TaxID=6039 RepID=A0AAX4JE02_9MICR
MNNRTNLSEEEIKQKEQRNNFESYNIENEYDLISEGLAKIKKQNNTFYNPAQKTNRDISILVIEEYFKNKKKLDDNKKNIKILDAMSATGLRGLRYLKEIPNSQIFFNDINDNAIETINNNLQFNGIPPNEINFFDKNFQNIREEAKNTNIIKSDCNVLMCTLQNYFDVIDIDPFGSCSEFMENAFRAIKHNGLICFTSTDKGVLITNESKCIVKYETIILKRFSQNEMALRGLLSCVSRHAAKFGISIEPLISLSLDFYLRVFVRIRKRSEKRVVCDNGLFYLCPCGNSKSVDRKQHKNIFNLNFKFFNDNNSGLITDLKDLMTNIIVSDDNNCDVCCKKMKICGPFWNKQLHSEDFVKNLLNKINMDDKRLIGIFNFLDQEIQSMWYYEIGAICKNLKTNCIKIKSMLTALKNLGFDVSLTHCDISAFKTNAPLKIIRQIVRIGNLESESEIFSKNEFVENLMSREYFKGLIASGLGPLPLPE